MEGMAVPPSLSALFDQDQDTNGTASGKEHPLAIIEGLTHGSNVATSDLATFLKDEIIRNSSTWLRLQYELKRLLHFHVEHSEPSHLQASRRPALGAVLQHVLTLPTPELVDAALQGFESAVSSALESLYFPQPNSVCDPKVVAKTVDSKLMGQAVASGEKLDGEPTGNSHQVVADDEDVKEKSVGSGDGINTSFVSQIRDLYHESASVVPSAVEKAASEMGLGTLLRFFGVEKFLSCLTPRVGSGSGLESHTSICPGTTEETSLCELPASDLRSPPGSDAQSSADKVEQISGPPYELPAAVPRCGGSFQMNEAEFGCFTHDGSCILTKTPSGDEMTKILSAIDWSEEDDCRDFSMAFCESTERVSVPKRREPASSEDMWQHKASLTRLPAHFQDLSNPFTVLEDGLSSLGASSSSSQRSSSNNTVRCKNSSPFAHQVHSCGATPQLATIEKTQSEALVLMNEQSYQEDLEGVSGMKRSFAHTATATNLSPDNSGSKRQARPRRDDTSSSFREWHLSGVDALSSASRDASAFLRDKPRSNARGMNRTGQSSRDVLPDTNTGKMAQWTFQFISSRGNEYFCDVDEEYLTDRFNLTGLNTEVQYYQYALDLVTDMFDLECEDDMREQIEKSARHLYGLVHARYIVTTRGLQKMMDKYKKGDFGKCPRVACDSQHLLPMGQNDNANVSAVKLYCARCEDLYNPKSQRHAAIDGAYFGTSFHNILFQVYPGLLPPKTQRRYEPRVFGFRVHAYAALARWQAHEKDKMKRRLEDLNVETGFEEEDEEPDSDIGIESPEEDGDALDDMFEGSRRTVHG